MNSCSMDTWKKNFRMKMVLRICKNWAHGKLCYGSFWAFFNQTLNEIDVENSNIVAELLCSKPEKYTKLGATQDQPNKYVAPTRKLNP